MRLFRRPPLRVRPPPAQRFIPSVTPPVTGTLATTNADDTLAASGTTTIVGTLARTNNNDTLAGTGTTTVVGTLATTNANDTLAASGASGAGSLNYTNANDTLVASGTTTIVGTLATTNANDTLAASGSAAVTGTVNVTNANDTLVAEGVGGPRQRRALGRNYIIKGKRYFNVTNEELAYLIARDLIDVTREDIRVTYTNKKARPIGKDAYASLKSALDGLEKAAPVEVYDESDDEAALLLLL